MRDVMEAILTASKASQAMGGNTSDFSVFNVITAAATTRQSVPGTPPDPHSSIGPELLTRLDLHFATSFLTGIGTVNHSSIWWSGGVAGLYSRTHCPNLSSVKQKTWFPSNNLFCLISWAIPPFIGFLRDTTLVKNEGTKATSCSLMVCWPRGSGAFALIAISPYPMIGIQPLPAARDASLIGLVDVVAYVGVRSGVQNKAFSKGEIVITVAIRGGECR
jgi:hypothetical protein